ncbi:MAG TPA: Na+/H+ antiporter [Candidatus Limnocylindria bacterium]|nr:Na+/H+ antiporter [Candidatus Limnocylindria bacterium]
MNDIQSILILLAAVAVLAPLAERLHLAQPIAFVLAGLGLSLIPHFPALPLDPEIVFLLCMPPLLYSQAYFTSWREFKREWQPISFLAVGLVIFTTVGTGLAFHWLLPNTPYAAGFVLGAIISPPDAVAVSAVARSLHLPHRLVTIMEGESLVNDATGLVALKFALAALATGHFSLALASVQFAYVAGGGVLIGFAIGWILARIRRCVKQDSVAVLLSLLSPFAAYVPADHLGLSGVLSVVTAGIYLGWDLPQHVRFSARLQGLALWQMVDFLLNGLIFLLIGLQVRFVVADLHGEKNLAEALKTAAVICALVVILRTFWVFAFAPIRRLIFPKCRLTDPMPPWQHLAVLSWAGVRGVVSLAAALALPAALAGGRPFPSRETIIFVTFAVILFTLVAQGLTFPWLVRKLGVRERANHEPEERKARARLLRAAIAAVESHDDSTHLGQSARDTVKASLQEHLAAMEDSTVESLGWSDSHHRLITTRRLRIVAVHAQRRELMRLRVAAEIPDGMVHTLSRELDFEEARLQF